MKLVVEISETELENVRTYLQGKGEISINAQIERIANGVPLNECNADDCRSLADIKELIERKANALDGVPISDGGGACIGLYFSIANDLPSVYPKEV